MAELAHGSKKPVPHILPDMITLGLAPNPKGIDFRYPDTTKLPRWRTHSPQGGIMVKDFQHMTAMRMTVVLAVAVRTPVIPTSLEVL